MSAVDVGQLAPAQLAAYLDLEHEASAPYSAYVFASPDVAKAWSRHQLTSGAAEFGPPHGRAYVEGESVVAMAAWLNGAELKRLRMKATLALLKFPAFGEDRTLGDRIRAASSTLLSPGPEDMYLSRVAVDPNQRGQGRGRAILDDLASSARSRGCQRLLLEVAEDRAPAVRLYERFGFASLGVVRAPDQPNKPPLAYRQMVLVL